jgi:membrane-bound lytic murein transglycosylase A
LTAYNEIMRLALAFALAMLLACGCATAPRARPAAPPALDDDLPLGPLLDAVEAELPLVERGGAAPIAIGDRSVARATYVVALRQFVALGRTLPAPAFLRAVADRFELVAAPPVLVTAYYEPLVDGARAPSARFSQPLYALPPEPARAATRAQIDSGGALAGRGLELCWVDPFDAFVLQTEGSGAVRLDDGTRLALDYAGNNGQPHVRLAPLLKDAIPIARMNMHTIEAYLRALPLPEMRRILEQNPRYVFFQPRRGAGAHTSLGAVATPGRTIATDAVLFPKGALAFLETTRPRAVIGGQPDGWVALRRLVLDQDTGSGIRGARVDLFWGEGEAAQKDAGVMKQPGRLFYLLPR